MTLVVGLHGYTGNARTFIRYGDADFNYFLEKITLLEHFLKENLSCYMAGLLLHLMI